MTCETSKSLLSEFTDETLDAPTAWQVQTHLAECGSCRSVSRELLSLRQMLQGLPTLQPSAQFEAKLAQRLALTRRPAPRISWQVSLQSRLRETFHRPAAALRPALALGFGLSAIAAAIWIPQFQVTPPDAVAVRVADRAFVADCVAQHRREAAAEPLADLAAQNLAGHLDSTPAPAPAVSDAELF